ncbi:MAG: hypothetical protein OHK0031_06680 [Anaerolineales bacterium]
MRILHVIPAYYPATYWGGPITSVYGLNNALAALPDTEIRVLASDSAGPRLNQKILASALDGAALYPGQQVTFTRRIAGNDFSPAMLRRLPAQIAWADIVHLTAVYSFPTLPVLLLCRLQNKPLVWSLRGALQDAQSLPFARKKMLKALWNRLCLALLQPQKTVLHATSPLEKELSARGLPGIETAVIRNGVETPAQMPQRQFRPNGQLRLLFLSRLDRKKGLENLLEALTLLSDLPISLSVFGTGHKAYQRSLLKLAESFGLSQETIRFYGHADGQAKRDAFFNADVFILPSYSENYGMVIAEALAQGLPVIASTETPWPQLEEKGCGLWVENSPAALAQAIRKMEKMNLAEMSPRGWQWMRDEFSWESIAGQMRRVYESLITPQGAGQK